MSMTMKKFAPKKLTISFVLACFLLTQVVGGILLYAKPANAQLVVSDPVTGAQTTVKNIKDFLKIVVVNGGIMAMINAASQFTQKIAYDLAVSLASGGGGEMPLFSTEGWGDYFESAALDAAGEFIGSFGDSLGVDLCAPPNPQLGLSLQLNLADTYGGNPPAPRCEWSQISSNWESFVSEVQTEEFLTQMASQFQVGYGTGSNDMDLALTGFAGVFNVQKSATETAGLTREEGQGFLPASEIISGNVKTPAEVIRQTSEIQTKGPIDAENVKTGLSGQAMSAGAEGILMQFVSTFVNTLLSKTMNQLFSKGMYSLSDLFSSGGGGVRDEEGAAWGGRKAAELAFADFLTPQIKEGGAVDILAQFVVCPEKFRGQNNCVMDGQFEAAVRQAQSGEPLTVAQAMDAKRDLLHADWPLIPPTDEASNQDPYCYSGPPDGGYCYSNLVKMRKARIIPIGWEIAALSSTSDRPVRLGEVVSKFYDCNAEDKADAEHPYCHLIDPNWILKAPPEQCRAKVYGPLLQTAENSFRQEVCVDAPTCIAEDDKGNCEGGWANCLREKNIWRLNGDKCDAQFDTCRALKRRDGQQASYLINTIDNGPPCTSEDVGCRWYSTRQEKDAADVWQWQDDLTTTRPDRIFFNKNITQCDEPGCNEFLRTTKDSRLNLVANSSFENISGTPPAFDGWTVVGGTAESSSDTYFGQKAMKLTGTVTQAINLGAPRGGRTFTISLYAKNCDEEPGDHFTFGGVSTLGGNFENSTSYQRITGPTHTFPAGDTNQNIGIEITNLGANCQIEAVQLEEAGAPSSYHEGWGRTGEALYLKSAPDYYACYDYNSDGSIKKTNDAEECKDFAKACEEKDVGCEKFTPANGDPWIPGVASYPDDYCPQECVGYQTFKQVSTDFEQEKFPVYFIPTTARVCSATETGCDQFTSLESEAVANFSAIRRCEKPSAGSATFYTWEGSDTSGYQLKNWNLKIGGPVIPAGETAGGPCTKLDPTDSTRCADDGIAGVCAQADLAANPDCREFYDAAGNKHYRLYSKTIIATDDCHSYRKTISNATDCGTSGGKWNTTKNECTYQVYLPETRTCSEAAVGCRAYRGNAGANVAIISNDNFDDSATAGWSGGAISAEALTVGEKSFSIARDVTAAKNLGSSLRKGGIYTLSFWAKGDSKLDIKFSGTSDRYFSINDTNPATPTAELSFDWRYFSLGPVYITWDPATDEKLQITPRGGTMAAYVDNIVLREVQDYIYLVKNSWNTPASCDRTFLIDYAVTNSANCSAAGGSWNAQTNECIVSGALPQAQLGCALYRDRANREHYLKSFTRLCSPDAAGCEKLIKTQNNSATGTEEFNTSNDADPSLSPEEQLSDNVKIPADELAFIIVDDTYKCKAENKSCAAFGAPKLDASGNVKMGEDGNPEYDTVAFLADPAKFDLETGKILCEVQYQGCEEYATTEGGTLYFKDPGLRTCEWKENITVSGRSVTGWFKKGVEPAEPCDPFAFYGGTYNIWKNGDIKCTLPNVCQTAGGCSCSVGTGGATGIAGSSCTVAYGKRTCPYSGWVGECLATANMCTKFIDPSDTKTSEEGEPYYYIKNDKLTPGNCNGMASQREGCVLLNDTSVTQLNYSANATYFSSEKKVGDPGGIVAPIDCAQNPDSPFCGRCSKNVHFVGYDEYHFGDYCRQDSDCPADFLTDTPVSNGEGCVTITNYSSDGRLSYSPGHGGSATIRAILLLSVFSPDKIVFEPRLAGKVNDSNTLLKVRRDRVCGEWLDCTSTNSTFDSQTGRQKTLCEQLGVCNSYNKTGEATKCLSWVDDPPPETYREILTKDLYVSRDISWSGMEYSGDSIYNQYQAADLRGVNIGTENNPKNVLAFVDENCYNAAGTAVSCGLDPPGYCASRANGSACGPGLCYNHLCVTNFRGDPLAPGVPRLVTEKPETVSCRAYPEQSSPFPTSVVKEWSRNTTTGTETDVKSKKSGFSGANVCERQFLCVGGEKSGAVCASSSDRAACGSKVCIRGTSIGEVCTDDADCPGDTTAGRCAAGDCQEFAEACECNYKKVSYSGGAITKYFAGAWEFDNLPMVCVGGPTPGKICSKIDSLGRRVPIADACGPTTGGGQCVSAQKEDASQGWQGYCLERDMSTSINGDPEKFSCLTWYPIDQLPGLPDVYNNYAEAGFSRTNLSYCLTPAPYKVLTTRPAGGYPYCASNGPAAGMAAVLPPLCKTDNWCDSDPDEAVNALRCGFDQSHSFCNDEGQCCDLDNEWVIMGPCEDSGSDCTEYTYNRATYVCVPKRSRHASATPGTPGALCNPETDLGLPVERRVDFPTSDHPAGDGEIDAYVIHGGAGRAYWMPSAHGGEGMGDCQKEGVESYTINQNSYFGCKELVKVAGSPDPIQVTNKAWTSRVWESEKNLHRIFPSSPAVVHPEINYGQATPKTPFGYNSDWASLFETNLRVPTCIKNPTDPVAERSMKLTTNPLADGSCPSGYVIADQTKSGSETRNESRPYLWIDDQVLPAGTGTCTRGTTACGGSGAANCNPGVSCTNYTCYEACNPYCPGGTCNSSTKKCVGGSTPGRTCTPDCPGGGACDSLTRRCPDGTTVCNPSPKTCSSGTCDPGGFCSATGSSVSGPTASCHGDLGLIIGQCTGTGDRCAGNSDCYAYYCSLEEGSCEGTCVLNGDPPPARIQIEPGGIELAKQRISQLFAQSYGFEEWKTKGGEGRGAYETLAAAIEPIDLTKKEGTPPTGSSTGEGWPIVPQIYALGGCIGEKCKQGAFGTVTVNGIDGNGLSPLGLEERHNVVGYGGKLYAVMQFFGRADKNTMPIVDVSTNWSDGSSDSIRNRPGKYKNHLGLKESNESWCDNEDFGRSDQACTDQYFMFTHTYSCPEDGIGKPACTGDVSTWGNDDLGCFAYRSCPEDVNGAQDRNGSCCVFKPKVQIKDNWGWCNGSCERGGTGGCYAGGFANQCNVNDSTFNHWTSFQGQVIVVPK